MTTTFPLKFEIQLGLKENTEADIQIFRDYGPLFDFYDIVGYPFTLQQFQIHPMYYFKQIRLVYGSGEHNLVFNGNNLGEIPTTWVSLPGQYDDVMLNLTGELCGKLRDYSAFASLITSNLSGFASDKKPFTFNTSETEIDFGAYGPAWLEYLRFACPTGFTAGSLQGSAIYRNLLGQEYPVSIGSVAVSEGQVNVNLNLNKFPSGSLTSIFTGRVLINSNFAPLVPNDCGDDAEAEVEDEPFIAELPPVDPATYPPLPPPPLEPTEPQVPISPRPTPYEPTTPIYPPQPPENAGCVCEEYIAHSIQSFSTALVNEFWKLRFDLENVFAALNKQLELNAEFQSLVIGNGVAQLKESLDSIADTLRLKPCNPEFPDGQTISEVVKEFAEKYEPALVEVLESEVIVNQDSDRCYSRKNLS